MADRLVFVDDLDRRITYTGPWFADRGSRDTVGNYGAPYAGTLHGTQESASLSMTFTGTGFIAFSSNNPIEVDGVYDPQWRCFLDGELIPSNGNFPYGLNNYHLCETFSLAAGQHTLRIDVTIQHNQTFWFDSIQYVPSGHEGSRMMVIEPTDAVLQDSMNETGSWAPFGPAVFMTRETGIPLRFNFIGTGLQWYGSIPQELPRGASTGTYSIDGGRPVTFNLNGLPEGDQISLYCQMFFQTPNLPAGTHSIEVIYGGSDGVTPLTLDYLFIFGSSTESPLPFAGPAARPPPVVARPPPTPEAVNAQPLLTTTSSTTSTSSTTVTTTSQPPPAASTLSSSSAPVALPPTTTTTAGPAPPPTTSTTATASSPAPQPIAVETLTTTSTSTTPPLAQPAPETSTTVTSATGTFVAEPSTLTVTTTTSQPLLLAQSTFSETSTTIMTSPTSNVTVTTTATSRSSHFLLPIGVLATSNSTSQTPSVTTSDVPPTSSSAVPDALTSASESTNQSIMAGTLAGMAALLALLFFLLCWKRHRRRRARQMVYSDDLQNVSENPPFILPVFSKKKEKEKIEKIEEGKGGYAALDGEDEEEYDDLHDPYLRDRPSSMNPIPATMGLAIHEDSGVRLGAPSVFGPIDVPVRLTSLNVTHPSVPKSYVQIPPLYSAQ